MARSPFWLRRIVCVALFTGVLLGAVFALSGCGGAKDDGWPKDHPGPKIVVSFAPIYCFAANVAGDDAVVRNLLTSSGPHNFQPTDRDARLLHRADLFFVNGIGLEGDKPKNMKDGSGNAKLKIVELGSRVPDDRLYEGSCHHEGEEHHEEHEHGKDPHIWLSPDYAIVEVEAIRDELKAADPAHAANYETRAAAYIAKLRKLKEDGIAMLKDKKDRRIVTFHDSMTYFAKTFDISIIGVVQKNPGTEPNDKQLKTLIALCTDPPVRVICVEPQYSNSNSAAELVKELKRHKVPDPALVELDPLETVASGQLTPDWYETKMRANLKALAEKLQ
ncbi:MAG TPA: zinc ABC transporter substrate-binding protein [Gemmata sp.]|nr:zinc ABC transporter substrate-binding protein [Gemmata sp.]